MTQSEPDRSDDRQVVVVGADGQPVGTVTLPDPEDGKEKDPTELVEQPAKVMRIGSMVKQLLEEVRAAPLDDAARDRLATVHTRSIQELSQGLAPELREELERLTLPFGGRARRPTPSCGSRRPSSSAGWRGCSTASRPRCSPSRWPPRCRSSRARGRPALPPGMPGAAQGQPIGPAHGTGQYL